MNSCHLHLSLCIIIGLVVHLPSLLACRECVLSIERHGVHGMRQALQAIEASTPKESRTQRCETNTLAYLTPAREPPFVKKLKL